MSKTASKILEKMKRSITGWSYLDFRKLYKGFGFKLIVGTNHDIYIHQIFTEIRDTIPRHRDLKPVYAREAVKKIETILELEKQLKDEDHEE